ncbi:hypothetical protein BDR26DRAFT_930287 [Obelidium mucronatum]|nr:hypothetical protein BDR26DRAFT_930287 [Obelidium mucronatum]
MSKEKPAESSASARVTRARAAQPAAAESESRQQENDELGHGHEAQQEQQQQQQQQLQQEEEVQQQLQQQQQVDAPPSTAAAASTAPPANSLHQGHSISISLIIQPQGGTNVSTQEEQQQRHQMILEAIQRSLSNNHGNAGSVNVAASNQSFTFHRPVPQSANSLSSSGGLSSLFGSQTPIGSNAPSSTNGPPASNPLLSRLGNIPFISNLVTSNTGTSNSGEADVPATNVNGVSGMQALAQDIARQIVAQRAQQSQQQQAVSFTGLNSMSGGSGSGSGAGSGSGSGSGVFSSFLANLGARVTGSAASSRSNTQEEESSSSSSTGNQEPRQQQPSSASRIQSLFTSILSPMASSSAAPSSATAPAPERANPTASNSAPPVPTPNIIAMSGQSLSPEQMERITRILQSRQSLGGGSGSEQESGGFPNRTALITIRMGARRMNPSNASTIVNGAAPGFASAGQQSSVAESSQSQQRLGDVPDLGIHSRLRSSVSNSSGISSGSSSGGGSSSSSGGSSSNTSRLVAASSNELPTEQQQQQPQQQRLFGFTVLGSGGTRILGEIGAGAPQPQPAPGAENFTALPEALTAVFMELINSIGAGLGGGLHLQGQPPASEEAISGLEVVDVTVLLEEMKRKKRKREEELRGEGGSDEGSEDEEKCVVCQDCFTCSTTEEEGVDSSVLRMPCKHLFHGSCLRPWLKTSNTCPTCRFEILTDNAEYNVGVAARMAPRTRALEGGGSDEGGNGADEGRRKRRRVG